MLTGPLGLACYSTALLQTTRSGHSTIHYCCCRWIDSICFRHSRHSIDQMLMNSSCFSGESLFDPSALLLQFFSTLAER